MRNWKKCRFALACLLFTLCLGLLGIPAGRTGASVKAASQKTVRSGWYPSSANKQYYYKNGKKLTGFQVIDGETYYFATNTGLMKTGKKLINGKRYYFYPSGQKKGQMQTGWIKLDGYQYYFVESGKRYGQMVAGWLTLNKKKYYFDKSAANIGHMVTGLKKIGKYTYYLYPSGKKKGQMQTGWQSIKSGGATYKYYFGTDGKMVTGSQKINKKTYYFNSSGQMQTGWVKRSGKWYYFDTKTGVLDKTKKKKLSELETLCNSIVNRVVKSSDSTNTKLSKLFQYVTYNYSYVRIIGGVGASGWSRNFALNMLKSGGGSCYSYASAFGYLVKAAMPELSVRIGWGSTPAAGGGLTPHGWCEVNIGGTWYVFDPDLYRYVYPGQCYYSTMGQVGGYYYNRNYETATFL